MSQKRVLLTAMLLAYCLATAVLGVVPPEDGAKSFTFSLG